MHCRSVSFGLEDPQVVFAPDIFLNRHLSYSLGSDVTEFGLVSSHGYVWKTSQITI
jgi:hypothetical protein